MTQRRLSELWRLPARKSVAFGRSVAREAEKKAIETARYVIPIACHTAMVYTVSGLVLHRLRRMARVGDAPDEAADVVERMLAEVSRIDPSFFEQVGSPALDRGGREPAGAARSRATASRPKPSTSFSRAARRGWSTTAAVRRR